MTHKQDQNELVNSSAQIRTNSGYSGAIIKNDRSDGLVLENLGIATRSSTSKNCDKSMLVDIKEMFMSI